MEGTGALTALLVERVAAHFEHARVDGDVVHTGIDDLRIHCEVAGIQDLGEQQSASLFFSVAGGPFGTAPAFASISGYEASPEAAVVEGACLWACTARPLLRAAAGLDPEAGENDDLEIFETTVHGRRFRVFAQQLGRSAGPPEGMDPSEQLRLVREAMPDELMVRPLVEATRMPALAADHSYLLSAFSMRIGDQAATEVKVHGGDWPALAEVVPAPDGLGSYALRELAVLVPLEPGRLTADSVQHTLDLIAAARTAPGQAAGWRGWRHHDGRVGSPLSRGEGDRGDLAEAMAAATELADFVRESVGPGAGPGYGLAPRAVADGVLLAEAGCGPGWILVSDGSVWADARPTTGEFVPVAGSLAAWYAAWLDHAISDAGPWQQWDWTACACVGILGQLAETHPDTPLGGLVGPNAMAIRAGDVSFASAGALLDPSHACTEVWSRFGVNDSIWPSGHLSGEQSEGEASATSDPVTPGSNEPAEPVEPVAPGPTSQPDQPPARRGFFGRRKR